MECVRGGGVGGCYFGRYFRNREFADNLSVVSLILAESIKLIDTSSRRWINGSNCSGHRSLDASVLNSVRMDYSTTY